MLALTEYNQDKYKTVSGSEANAEIKVKGSRFTGRLFHVQSKQEADRVYREICKKYYNATHNCYAWRISRTEFRYSDDGEPSATAGIPILKVLESHDLVEVLLVVTRYFGGTKLGTGGLARAYADAAVKVIEAAKIVERVKYAILELEADYAAVGDIQHILKGCDGRQVDSRFEQKVWLKVEVPVSRKEIFEQQIFKKFYSNENVTIRQSGI